jgi:translation initiation factor 1
MSKKQKKIRDFSDLASFAYSTNPDYEPEYEDNDIEGMLPNEQYLEAHFSKKGRGGKVVTVIKGFEGTEQELKALGKELKNKMGVGGSVKDDEIIIQGNNREKIVAYLKEKGYNVKKIGG